MALPTYLLEPGVFGPDLLESMTRAFEQACLILEIPPENEEDRRALARRVIALARDGVVDAADLRDRTVTALRGHS